jgi:hypothetical protein
MSFQDQFWGSFYVCLQRNPSGTEPVAHADSSSRMALWHLTLTETTSQVKRCPQALLSDSYFRKYSQNTCSMQVS